VALGPTFGPLTGPLQYHKSNLYLVFKPLLKTPATQNNQNTTLGHISDLNEDKNVNQSINHRPYFRPLSRLMSSSNKPKYNEQAIFQTSLMTQI
jgi:hypothetical protein